MMEGDKVLCPKCRREDKDSEMEIQGTKWYCPTHKLYVDFPIREPSPGEYKKLLASKDEYITELEDENAELKLYIQRLER